MTDLKSQEFHRLISEAVSALNAAKAASDRGDVATYSRCLQRSQELGKQAKELEAARRAARWFSHTHL